MEKNTFFNLELKEGKIDELKYIYGKLQKDFAPDELKKLTHLELLMSENKYRLLLAQDKTINKTVGYAFVYEITEPKTLWLDYMVIESKFQSAGYGSVLYEKIAGFYPGILGVFSEVEIPDPTDVTYTNQLRRIRFYERLGAKRLSFDYRLPTYDGGLPMYLYFRASAPVNHLTGQEIKEAVNSAFEYIHSDIRHREKIREECFKSIPDLVWLK
ncbi:MAG TPA: GNAT family N-acetyltransferase [Ruminiclostridium sp.]|nr:GNAT family N-acetyltransferase [Ruminiclostridium sp.]